MSEVWNRRVWDRRQLLRTAFGGLLVAACAGQGSSVRGAIDDDAGTTAPTFDPRRPFWAQGNFAPVKAEHTVTDLETRGEIPSSLRGAYVRNGPNPRTGTPITWFLGDGMLHRVGIGDGGAEYRNRWVRTPLYEAAADFATFGAAPGRTVSQSNVSVLATTTDLFSMGEVGWPYRIDPATLATIGPDNLGGTATANVTAHPKVHPTTGDHHFFGYGFVPPYLTYWVRTADGRAVRTTEVPVSSSTLMHDFAVTERYAVFWEFPVLFDAALAASGGVPYRWAPGYGARVGVLPHGRPGSEVAWADLPEGYVFHGTNAYEDGDDIVVVVSHLPSLLHDGSATQQPSILQEWRLSPSATGWTVAVRTLDDHAMDLPAIDQRHRRKATRAWYADYSINDEDGFRWRGLSSWDFRDERRSTWAPPDGIAAGEPCFVPRNVGADEGDGWCLSLLYHPRVGRSSLGIFDALDIAGGPIGEVLLPDRVPFGFHGTWLPEEAD